MKLQQVENVHGDIRVAVSNEGPTAPFDGAISINHQAPFYLSRKERWALAQALIGDPRYYLELR